MMFSCAPASRGSSVSSVEKRGRTLRVDIHCHYLNTEVAERVTPLNPAQHEPMAVWSNAATREANVQQGKERGARLSDIKVRLKEMDRMGIDIQAVSPAPHQTYYWTDPDMGQELSRRINERLAEIVSQHPDRFVRSRRWGARSAWPPSSASRWSTFRAGSRASAWRRAPCS